MNDNKKNSDLFTKEETKHKVDEIVTYFTEEYMLELGLIGGGEILEFFLESFASEIYNKGVEDSRQIINKEVEDMDLALDVSLRN